MKNRISQMLILVLMLVVCQKASAGLYSILNNNPGFEGGANPPTGWTQETNATVVSDTSPHSGTNCMKVTAAAANVGGKQNVTLVSGKYYTVSGWAKATAGDSATIIMDKGDTTTVTVGTITATSWTKIATTFLSTGTAGVIYCRAVANTDIVWFDDCSIIQLDQVGASTATPASDINSYRIGKYNDSNGAFEVKGGATLTLPTIDNIDHDKGSLSFKFYPNGWDGADNAKHKLFSLQGHSDELIVIDKTAANNLEYYYMGDNGIPRLLRYAVNSTNLPINTWSDIYIAWENTNPPDTELFLNNVSVGTVISSPGYYGTWHEGVNQADAYFDDVFIFDKALKVRNRTRIYRLAHRASFNELKRRGWW